MSDPLEISNAEYEAVLRVYQLIRKTQVEGAHAPGFDTLVGLVPSYEDWDKGNEGQTIPANLDTGTPEVVIGANSVQNAIALQYIALLRKLRETAAAPVIPELLNSWVDFGGAYKPARIWKDDLNVVRGEGMVKSGAGSILQFPVGWRPDASVYHATVSNNVFGVIEVLANGFLLPQIYNNAHVSLEGLTFRASQ